MIEAVEAFDVLLAPGWEDYGGRGGGSADSASVGMAGEHDIDEVATGMVDDLVGVVGRVALRAGRGSVGSGRGWPASCRLGWLEAGSATPESQRGAARRAQSEGIGCRVMGIWARDMASGDDGVADAGVVVAHDAEALGAGEVAKDFGAAVGVSLGEGDGGAGRS